MRAAAFCLLLLFISGCTTSLSVRGIQSPNSSVGMKDPIFVDSQTDMGIEIRRYFTDAGVIAYQAGVNATTQDKAKYVLFLNFRPGLTYDPNSKDFGYSFVTSFSETFNGVINAGLFLLADDNKSFKKPSVWEGWVEVRDIRSTERKTEALGLLFSKIGQEANLRVALPATVKPSPATN
jgi:hypothetical protein